MLKHTQQHPPATHASRISRNIHEKHATLNMRRSRHYHKWCQECSHEVSSFSSISWETRIRRIQNEPLRWKMSPPSPLSHCVLSQNKGSSQLWYSIFKDRNARRGLRTSSAQKREWKSSVDIQKDDTKRSRKRASCGAFPETGIIQRKYLSSHKRHCCPLFWL